MDAICSSETLHPLLTTRRYKPEECGLHSHRRENLKFKLMYCCHSPWHSPQYDVRKEKKQLQPQISGFTRSCRTETTTCHGNRVAHAPSSRQLYYNSTLFAFYSWIIWRHINRESKEMLALCAYVTDNSKVGGTELHLQSRCEYTSRLSTHNGSGTQPSPLRHHGPSNKIPKLTLICQYMNWI
jgi:hypothetical protein